MRRVNRRTWLTSIGMALGALFGWRKAKAKTSPKPYAFVEDQKFVVSYDPSYGNSVSVVQIWKRRSDDSFGDMREYHSYDGGKTWHRALAPIYWHGQPPFVFTNLKLGPWKEYRY
jgi:hypothetical protein